MEQDGLYLPQMETVRERELKQIGASSEKLKQGYLKLMTHLGK